MGNKGSCGGEIGIQTVGRYIIENYSDEPDLFTDTESSIAYCMSVDGDILEELITRIQTINSDDDSMSLLNLLRQCSPFLIAASIKAYLKDLDEPLVPRALYDPLIQAYKKTESKMAQFMNAKISQTKINEFRAKALVPVLEGMPQFNFAVIVHLMQMFASMNNGETSRKLAYAFTPLILQPSTSLKDPAKLIQLSKLTIDIVELMIDNYEVMFTIQTYGEAGKVKTEKRTSLSTSGLNLLPSSMKLKGGGSSKNMNTNTTTDNLSRPIRNNTAPPALPSRQYEIPVQQQRKRGVSRSGKFEPGALNVLARAKQFEQPEKQTRSLPPRLPPSRAPPQRQPPTIYEHNTSSNKNFSSNSSTSMSGPKCRFTGCSGVRVSTHFCEKHTTGGSAKKNTANTSITSSSSVSSVLSNWKCKSCFASIEKKAKFCTECGKPRPIETSSAPTLPNKPMPSSQPTSKSCPKCSAKDLPLSCKFCTNCAYKMTDSNVPSSIGGNNSNKNMEIKSTPPPLINIFETSSSKKTPPPIISTTTTTTTSTNSNNNKNNNTNGRVCGKCGFNKLSDTTKFCIECGNKLIPLSSTTTTTTLPPPIPQEEEHFSEDEAPPAIPVYETLYQRPAVVYVPTVTCCHHCGEKLEPDDMFCLECGTKVIDPNDVESNAREEEEYQAELLQRKAEEEAEKERLIAEEKQAVQEAKREEELFIKHQRLENERIKREEEAKEKIALEQARIKKEQEEAREKLRKEQEEEEKRIAKAEADRLEKARKEGEEAARLEHIRVEKEHEERRIKEEKEEKERLRKQQEEEQKRADELAKREAIRKEEERQRKLKEEEEERLQLEIARKKAEEERARLRQERIQKEKKLADERARKAKEAEEKREMERKERAERMAKEKKEREVKISSSSTTTTSKPVEKTSKMSNVKAMWASKQTNADEAQKRNIFSKSYTGEGFLKPGDKGYGHAPEGSKSAERAKRAKIWVKEQLKILIEVLDKIGTPQSDGSITVCFGELFVAYETISDTLVGMLQRAKKFRLIQFEGEMLFQGQSNNVVITLLPEAKNWSPE